VSIGFTNLKSCWSRGFADWLEWGTVVVPDRSSLHYSDQSSINNLRKLRSLIQYLEELNRDPFQGIRRHYCRSCPMQVVPETASFLISLGSTIPSCPYGLLTQFGRVFIPKQPLLEPYIFYQPPRFYKRIQMAMKYNL
jgi:hypothetical protein